MRASSFARRSLYFAELEQHPTSSLSRHSRLHYVKQSRHSENRVIFEPRGGIPPQFDRARKKRKQTQEGYLLSYYHRPSRLIIFCSAGILHGEPAAVGEARFGIVCASSNRHSLKAYSASFEKRALEHFAYVDVLVRGGGELEREALCAMMTFPLWDRLGSPRQQQYTTGANTGSSLGHVKALKPERLVRMSEEWK